MFGYFASKRATVFSIPVTHVQKVSSAGLLRAACTSADLLGAADGAAAPLSLPPPEPPPHAASASAMAVATPAVRTPRRDESDFMAFSSFTGHSLGITA
jgi:hypothetical protein